MAAINHRLALSVTGMRAFGLHVHDVEQERRTLANRHLFETPEPLCLSSAWYGFTTKLADLTREIGPKNKCTFDLLLKGKSGYARRRMRDGIYNLHARGVTRYDSLVTAMQKLELYEVDKIIGKEDRCIQYRSTTFNAALGRFTVPIEHALLNCVGDNKSGVPMCAKGRTVHERAVQLLLMSDMFRRPVYVSLDHSRFDAHVHKKLLKQEHKVYKKVHGYNPELCALLSKQLRNYGTTVGGIKYVADGKRMSGDVTTSLGNTVLNSAMLRAWLSCSGVDGEVFLDGDDSVIVVEKDDLARLLPVKEFMLKLGMTTVIEGITENISEVEFCQGRVAYGSNGPYFCRNVEAMIPKLMLSPERRGADTAFPIMRASILCALTGSCSQPMLAPFARWLQKNPGEARAAQADAYYNALYGMGVVVEDVNYSEPNNDERMSFFKAWGITPDVQIAFEESVDIESLMSNKRDARYRVNDDDAPAPVVDFEGCDDEEEVWKGAVWNNQTDEFKQRWHLLLT
jgi:hypothetical protein